MTESDDSAHENAPRPLLDTSDLAEIRAGIRKGWDLPDKIRRVLPAQALAILVDKKTTVKDKLRAVEILERMVEMSWGMTTDEETRVRINDQLQKMLSSIMPPVRESGQQTAVSDPPSDEGGGIRD